MGIKNDLTKILNPITKPKPKTQHSFRFHEDLIHQSFPSSTVTRTHTNVALQYKEEVLLHPSSIEGREGFFGEPYCSRPWWTHTRGRLTKNHTIPSLGVSNQGRGSFCWPRPNCTKVGEDFNCWTIIFSTLVNWHKRGSLRTILFPILVYQTKGEVRFADLALTV